MLNALEQRIVAVLADRLSTRAHLTVLGGAAAAGSPAAGQARAVVSVGEFAPDHAFLPERVREVKSPPTSRRVLGLSGTVRVRFEMQPAVDLAAARNLLLEDVSLACHALAEPTASAGRVFDTGADSGFRVLGFYLEKGNGTATGLSSELLYRCQVEIWPPTPPEPAGVMRDFSRSIALQPLAEEGEHAVPAGRPIALRVRQLPVRRPGAAGQPATGLSLAVKVLSTAPPASRGTVTSGTAGAEPGVRLVPVADPETTITFQAPALASGERTEYVALHYATPEGRTGVFLGSIAVKIRGGA